MMIPCLKSFGGSCQDTVMLVELLAIAVKLLGASEGTAIETFQNNLFDQPINYLSHILLFSMYNH